MVSSAALTTIVMVSLAPEDEWPKEWLAQQQTGYVVTVDRRLSSLIALDPVASPPTRLRRSSRPSPPRQPPRKLRPLNEEPPPMIASLNQLGRGVDIQGGAS